MNADTDPNSPVACLARVRAVLGHPGLTDRERVVLAWLASHDQTRFVPTLPKLAEQLWGDDDRRHRDNARKMLRQLEVKEVLRVEYKRGGRIKRYVIMLRDVDRTSPPIEVAEGKSAADQGDVQPTSLPEGEAPQVTLSQRHLTPKGHRGDVGSTGLRTRTTSTSEEERDKEEGDAEPTSPKLNGRYLKDDSTWRKRKKAVKRLHSREPKATNPERAKAILQHLKKNEAGLTRIELADFLGLNFIDIRDDVKVLIEAGSIHAETVHNWDRYFFGPKESHE